MNQTIIWTALPNGLHEDKREKKARLSVYVSPRLTTSNNRPATLADFPLFIHWPDNVPEFNVEFSWEKPPIPPRKAGKLGPPPDKALWAALLPPTTPVNSYSVRSFSHRTLVSSPMAELAEYLRDKYTAAANLWPTAIPNATDWKGVFGRLADPVVEVLDRAGVHTKWQNPLKSLGRSLGADLAIRGDVKTIDDAIAGIKGTLGADQSELQDLQQLSLFAQAIQFLGPQTARWKDLKLPVAQPPDLDFHHLLAALAEYPIILRKLGIVIDLEIDATSIPSASASRALVPPSVRVVPSQSMRGIEAVTPWTRVDIAQFKPATNDGADGFGFLPIGKPGSGYSLIEVDVHGGAVKVAQTMRDTARDKGNGAKALPGLRTGGISVAMKGRVDDFQKRTLGSDQLQKDLRGKKDSVLFARDLTRGYRVDVLPFGGKQWRSLCQRDGTYNFHLHLGSPQRGRDEGTITAAVTESADPSAKDPRIYFPQTLFRWTGWSLSVPRPGKTVGPAVQNTNAPPVPGLQVTFRVPPGSLPRLRFGQSYRLRMRPVDLAGNSLPPETPLDDPHYYLEDRFHRFEPINPPALVPVDKETPGEAIERMVIRSTPTSNSYDDCERVLMPPQTSQSIAEQHGMFDHTEFLGPDGVKVTMLHDAWKDMHANREKSLGADPGLQPGTGPQPVASKGDIFRSIIPKDPNDANKVTYLPDPAAAGVLVRPVPDSVKRVSSSAAPVPLESPPVGVSLLFGTKSPVQDAPPWPLDPLSFVVRGIDRDDNTPPHLMPTATDGFFNLLLPQAEVCRYWVSSYPDPNLLTTFAIYDWMTQGSKQRAQAKQGISWMLMPYRELTVVHAVSQPLDPPKFKSLTNKARSENQTFVNLEATISVHRKSTGKLEVSAQWDDFIDDPSSPANPTVGIKRHAQIKEVHVEMKDPVKLKDPVEMAMVQSFHDTKHRNVTYIATATTRFREYFDDPKLSFTRDSTSPDSPLILIHNILSTARPAAPKILYAIPAFPWSFPAHPVIGRGFPNILESVRQGGGLRVYLERPWYSSGDGEKLGIVLAKRPLGDVTAELQKLVTCWGSDPAWPSDQPRNQANKSQFLGDAHYFTGVQLDETSEPVDVAAYPVHWDGVRWYADLQIDVNLSDPTLGLFDTASFTYFPFIRLALVRFQADSLSDNPDLRASRVVLMDAVQVVPERSLKLEFHSQELDGAKLDSVTITVAGGQQSVRRNYLRVFLEKTLNGQPPSGDFDWTQLGDNVFAELAGDGPMLCNVTVPLPSARGSVPMRVVVQESEWYDSPHWVQPSKAGLTGSRVVYADALQF